MSGIKISELNFTGSDLFEDSESFLDDLNSQDMGDILAG
jgi:hypothetical protein